MNFDKGLSSIAYKKMSMLRSLILILALALSSCYQDTVSEIDIPTREKDYFIEAYATPDGRIEATLYKTIGVKGSLLLDLVWGAEIWVSDSETRKRLPNLFYKNTETGRVVNYFVKFQTDHNTLFLDAKMPDGTRLSAKTIKIKEEVNASIVLDQKNWTIGLKKLNKSDDGYFSASLRGYNKAGKEFKQDYYFYPSSEVETMRKLLIPKDIIKLEYDLHRITRENFEFQMSVIKAKSANVDPFTAPVSIKGNIKGGLGLFTYIIKEQGDII